MFANKYLTIEQIGQGTFSQIYKGRNIRTNELVAIKVESKSATIKLLQNETRIYQYLNGHKGIPTIKWFGVDDTNYYMVISLLGKSLETFKREQPNERISLSIVLNIGIQIIRLLETIHETQLIHRDVKPDNFLFGKDDNINIIDFGFCKNYIKNGKHIPLVKIANIIGTPNFISISTHELNELSRRDDLESLGYMLIYLFMGKLEWEHITDNNIIKNMKYNIFENTQIPLVLLEYITYIKNMKFNENPDYNRIISLLYICQI
jgi:serine/threonine protein kinase